MPKTTDETASEQPQEAPQEPVTTTPDESPQEAVFVAYQEPPAVLDEAVFVPTEDL